MSEDDKVKPRVIAASISLMVLGTAVLAVQAFGEDPRARLCPVGGSNRVAMAFEMAHARDYRTVIPKMGRSPELEVDRRA